MRPSRAAAGTKRRAHQYLKNNQETLNAVLKPNQMHQIRNVNNAANVLDLDKGYKGAFAQFQAGGRWTLCPCHGPSLARSGRGPQDGRYI